MSIFSLFTSFSNTKHRISFEKFDELAKNANIEILDLRKDSEIKATGIIEKAKIKNYFDSDFTSYVKNLDQSKQYLIYCHAGGRSAKAVNKFLKAGLTVFEFGDGIKGWMEKGRKLVNKD